MATLYKYCLDGTQSRAPYEGGHHTTDWQREVEGFFETHDLPDGNVAIWNSEANWRPDDFPVNHLFLAHYPVGMPIRGNVLVVSPTECRGLT